MDFPYVAMLIITRGYLWKMVDLSMELSCVQVGDPGIHQSQLHRFQPLQTSNRTGRPWRTVMKNSDEKWWSGWWFQHVSTPLKNISQLGWLFPIIIWKNKKCSKPPTSEFCENMRNRFWGRTPSICMRVSRPLNPAKFSLATIMTKNTEHILENLKSALEQAPWNLWFSIGRNCQFSTKHENLLSTPAKKMHAIWAHNPK